MANKIGGPNLIPTAPDWSAWAGLMLTTHFDLVWDPFWVPGGPKRAPFGPKCPLALNFLGPFLCGTFFSKYRLVGCPEHRSGMLCSSSTVIVHIEPPSLRKRYDADGDDDNNGDNDDVDADAGDDDHDDQDRVRLYTLGTPQHQLWPRPTSS